MDVFCIDSVDIDSIECIRDPCLVSTVSTYIALMVWLKSPESQLSKTFCGLKIHWILRKLWAGMCGCVLTVVSTVLTNIAFNALHALIFVLSQRNWLRPQHWTGSLYGGCSQGVDWPTWLFRQWPVLGLWHRARGTSTWAALGDLDRDKHCSVTFLFTDIFKNSYNVSQIISKVWNKGFSTVVSSWL